MISITKGEAAQSSQVWQDKPDKAGWYWVMWQDSAGKYILGTHPYRVWDSEKGFYVEHGYHIDKYKTLKFKWLYIPEPELPKAQK